MIRLGPIRLAANVCPGGIVVHVYGTADGRLLVEGVVNPWSSVEVVATHHAELAEAQLGDGEGMCVVTYDGDTGERVIAPGHVTGDVLGWQP